MDSYLFWFSDEQWTKIVPHLPANQPGPERDGDRRILSGIMHVLKACPKDYGPHKTVYNGSHVGANGGFGKRYSLLSPVLPSHRNKLHWIAAM